MFKKFSRWLSAMVGLLPAVAFADSSGPFTVKSSDISVKILSQIFGGLMPDGGVDAFAGAITTFNGAVLIVGGILATYTLLAGTLGTAHDGEMLGKKFSSVWIPIRYALGTALVLPVLSGGYCMMQQMVMWCILQGVGLANSVWISYLNTAASSLSVPVKMTATHRKAVLDFANNVALAQICVQANASIMNAGGTGGGLVDNIGKSLMTYDYKVAYNTDNSVAYFGDQAGKLTLLTRTQCGIANLSEKPAAQNITPNSAASGGKLGDISSAFKLGDISPVYQAHIDQSKALIDQMGILAAAAVAADKPLAESSVKTATDAYVTAIETSANGYANGNSSPFAGIVAASEQQGWLLAGAWFTKLASINQTLNDAVNATPNASATLQLGSGFKVLDAVQPKIGIVRTEILESMNISIPDSSSDEKDDAKGKQTQSSGMWSKIVQSIVGVFTGLDLESLQNSEKHPLLVLQDAGNRMITAWSVAATTLMAVLALTGWSVLGNHWDGGPVVFTLIGFAFMPIAGLVALGFTLAYLLPNLPFLMWIGIVLGWLIMCVEAVLAAPLWAVMHLHPNGDDLTGRGGNGYMLLLGLLLRPALTIFGLIAALVLTDVMGEFVNKIFFSVFFSGTGSGLVTILSVVFSMTVYTSAMVQLFRKTFSLMHVIPDQLMRWIGGGQEQMGQYAGGLAEAGQRGVQAAGTASSFLGEKTATTGGNVIGNLDQIQRNRAGKKDRELETQNKINSQKEKFTEAGVGDSGQQAMASRTEDSASLLSQSSPQSQTGLTLSKSQEKMLAARGQGMDQVSSQMGQAGKQEYAQALASGEYQGKTAIGMNGSNDFEREANFASFVSNAMMSNNQAKQQEIQSQSQAQSGQQLSALQDISAKLNNGGKPNDSTTTPAGVGSGSMAAGNSVPLNPNSQNNINDQIAQTNLVNSLTATDLYGNLLNPIAAQALANSGTVNAFGRGLTPNASNVLLNGGIVNPSNSNGNGNGNGTPIPNQNNTAAPSGATIPDANSADGHSQAMPGPDPFIPAPNNGNNGLDAGNVDSSGNAQFNPYTPPTQSFDGSGNGETGNNGSNNPDNFDRS